MPASTSIIPDTKSTLKGGILEPGLLSAGKKRKLRFVLRLLADDSGGDGSEVCQITLALLEVESKRDGGSDARPLAQAGAEGSFSLEELIQTVSHLVRLAPASMPTFTDLPVSGPPDEEPLARMAEEITAEKLSPREIDVLKLLMDGVSNKRIARELSIAEPTVKCHVKSILRKLNARSRFEAGMRAMKMKLYLHGAPPWHEPTGSS